MADIRSEDTLLFMGLTPSITKMKPVYEAIKEFCENKKADDPSDRFNIILFQDDGPNYLEDFTLYPDNIMVALQSLEPVLVRANIGGGIMVGVSFVIDVFKRISEKCFRMIILTDSGSIKIPEMYIPALENLIDKVREFPFFLDIVRLDIDDPREDLHLMKLARRCNGDIHEINDVRALPAILEVLAIKREIITGSLVDDDDFEGYIEDKPFFENLADQPQDVLEEATCSICFQKDTKGIVRCPKCETIAHKKCWSQWAKNSNIGIAHVFRCHNCYNLIRLDEKFVYAIQTGKEYAEEVEVKVLNLQDYLEGLESGGEGPQIIQVQDPLAVSWDEEEEAEVVFQFEDEEEVKIEEDYVPLKDEEIKIVWCSCGKITTNEFRKCPKCGALLD